MLPAFLLALREGLEIALVIGIVLGALRKIERAEQSRVVWGGTITAAVVSLLAAFILHSLGTSLEGEAEEIFEGVMMLLAAGVLTWMIFWMQRQSRGLQFQLESDVRDATMQTGMRGLFVLAFVAVLREGIELGLFLTATALAINPWETLIGAGLGLIGAIILGWALFKAVIRLDLRKFFKVTSFLLLLFAAGLVAHGVHEFIEVGWLPPLVENVWDTNMVVNEVSLPGQVLQALFGYNGNPSLIEVLAYFFFFIIMLSFLRRHSQLVVKKPAVP